jgi:hypothetical protein
MATGLGLQLFALGVFLTPRRQSKQMPMSIAVTRALGLDPSIAAAMPAHYTAALSTWRRHVVDTRRQVAAWRYAAVASMALCVGLGGALSLALIRPAVALQAVENTTVFRMTPDRACSDPRDAPMPFLVENEWASTTPLPKSHGWAHDLRA